MAAIRPDAAKFFTEMVKLAAGLFVAGMGAIGFLARPESWAGSNHGENTC
jgi:hypothetical protein